ncbi:MAG: hypothetical protein QHC90_28065 [Shinella sp.]|nr:hypothetical protein [Shinella sp.]
MTDLITLLNKRADLDTVLGRNVWTSVKVNDLFVPANSLQTRLNSFGRNLALFTHVTDYEVQLIGSASSLDYRGNKFLVSTAHQVHGRPGEDIGIVVPGENTYMTSAGYTRYRPTEESNDTDARDLCAFDFTPQSVENGSLSQRFFRVDANTTLEDGDDIIGLLAYGCPYVDQKYNIVDQNTVGTVIRSMTCEPIEQSADAAVGKCRTVSPMDFDANGLSGGPVFASVLEHQEIVLKFAGVINRAGGGVIHYIKARAVTALLDKAID